MTNITHRRFLIEEEYVKSFTDRGETVPPFLVFQPFVTRKGVKGYMVPCKSDHPDAELETTDVSPSDHPS